LGGASNWGRGGKRGEMGRRRKWGGGDRGKNQGRKGGVKLIERLEGGRKVGKGGS